MVMETIYNPSRLKTQIEDAYKLMKDAKKRGCDALIIEDGTNIVLYDIAMDSLYIYDMSIEKLSVMDVVKRRTDMHKFCIYTKLDEGELYGNPASSSLSQADDVWNHIPVLVGEKFPCSAEARLNFVEDEDDAVAIADFPKLG